MIRINDILDKITEYYSEADIDMIEKAYIFSARVHQGMTRLNGEPYLVHPLEVAWILAELKLDTVSIAAGLLHDVIEDTWAKDEEIRNMFGNEVCHIVSGVTKISNINFDNSQARQAESLRKMILAMADDIRVILIKLADRLHNMRTLQFHKEHKRKLIAQETLDIYAPIANRLGMYWIKKELEDIAFMYIQNDEYLKIENLVKNNIKKSEENIEIIKNLIKKKMSEADILCDVIGRYKHYYSIYQKMIHQNLSFDELYDIIAFRIIVASVQQCYEALGNIHSLWKPIAHKFKDYISVPKQNMYQSLHTSVIGPFGDRVEIQIRTKEMDNVAKSGIAAHWSYKEGRNIDENARKTFSWLQNLVENQANFRDPSEFLENVRIDLFPDEVYVFTPKGEIKSLPRGANPIDFAYLIHTELGNQCIGAKVNHRIVPLQYELKNGDLVDIITLKGHNPSKDWLKFVKTVKARSKIRQWIKSLEKERSISLGIEICEKAFQKNHIDFNIVIKSEEMIKIVEDFGFKTTEDLMASIGYGRITPLQLIQKISKPTIEEKQQSILNRLISKVRRKKNDAGVTVSGINDVLIRFGKCCQPVPGDSVVGYITQGYGVTVHQTNCVHALKMNPERQIEVKWNKDVVQTYPVKIRVQANDRVGLLADIALNISQNSANILSANTREIGESQKADILFTISIKDKEHLDKVISSIKKVKFVQGVNRE